LEYVYGEGINCSADALFSEVTGYEFRQEGSNEWVKKFLPENAPEYCQVIIK